VALLSSPLRPVGLPQVLSEAARRFGHVLEASGVTEALRQRGICEGDTVVMGEVKRGRLAPLHFSGIHNGTADYNLATLKGHSTRHGSAREETHAWRFWCFSLCVFRWSLNGAIPMTGLPSWGPGGREETGAPTRGLISGCSAAQVSHYPSGALLWDIPRWSHLEIFGAANKVLRAIALHYMIMTLAQYTIMYMIMTLVVLCTYTVGPDITVASGLMGVHPASFRSSTQQQQPRLVP